MDKMSALHNSQMYEVNKRLEALEQVLTKMQRPDTVSEKLEDVLSLVKEGAEGNTWVVMDLIHCIMKLSG